MKIKPTNKLYLKCKQKLAETFGKVLPSEVYLFVCLFCDTCSSKEHAYKTLTSPRLLGLLAVKTILSSMVSNVRKNETRNKHIV